MVKLAVFILILVVLLAFLGSNLEVVTSLFSSFDYILRPIENLVNIVGAIVEQVLTLPYTALVLGAFIITTIIINVILHLKG